MLWSGTRSNRSRPRYHRRATSVWMRCSICRSDGIPYRYPTSRYFTSTAGSIAGRPYLRLYRWAVSSRTKDKSSLASSFLKKCPSGTKSSIVTMCSFSCIPIPPLLFVHFIIFPVIHGLCQQPQLVPNFIVTRRIIISTGKHHDTGSQTLKSRTSITGRMRIQMEHRNLRRLEGYT